MKTITNYRDKFKDLDTYKGKAYFCMRKVKLITWESRLRL